MKLPTIAVVIPVLGDCSALERLLTRIAAWRDPALELIVVAGNTSPAVRRLAERAGARYLCTRACRGEQLDRGARAARSDILWFLHADAAPPAEALSAIRGACLAGMSGGYFRFRFQGPPGPVKRLLAAAINLRAKFGIPYGDQGLFATREAYWAAGGYPPEPLFEEVALVRGLRHHGRFCALKLSMGVDPRRWERDGWMRRSLENRWLALRYALGAAPRQLAASYGRRHGEPDHG